MHMRLAHRTLRACATTRRAYRATTRTRTLSPIRPPLSPLLVCPVAMPCMPVAVHTKSLPTPPLPPPYHPFSSLLDSVTVASVCPSTVMLMLRRRFLISMHVHSCLRTSTLACSSLPVPYCTHHMDIGLVMIICHQYIYHFSLSLSRGHFGCSLNALAYSRRYNVTHTSVRTSHSN
ncbi:hypothetical protein B0H21DRAFT_499140 [Amylocystis lapponica]|nr:hypothetical protein B0H21DRAFT_499140 [Amylocystis lapponica]